MEQAENQQSRRLSAALAAAGESLSNDPVQAETRARAILKSVPGQQHALQLLVAAKLAQGDAGGARAVLELAAASQPNLASVHYELGLLLAEMDNDEAAIEALSRVVELEPAHPGAWRALGDRLTETGRTAEAARAYANHFQSALNDLKFVEDAAAFASEQPAMAEGMLSAFLDIYPTDVSAIHKLAHANLRSGKLEDAEKLFARALELAPTFKAARQDYIHYLVRRQNPVEANRQLDVILGQDPNHMGNRGLKAAALLLTGGYGPAIECYEALVRDFPEYPINWSSYAYALRTVGRHEDSIAAYRQSLALHPGFGEAWWGLANLKTFRFTPADIETMCAQLEQDDLGDEDGYQMHFALGKALEDQKAYAKSFEHYRVGNLIRRAGIHYNPDDMSELVRRSKELFTREFFRAREGFGCPAPDPIFIVGLPRAGSTLIEQILSSHSAIEGTSELPELVTLSIKLSAQRGKAGESDYLDTLSSLDAAALMNLGQEFLAKTKTHRRLGKPFFTDKMPNNFHHLGLIHLILPNAKIIDARRHPLACCFSNYKQHFSSGIGPTYDLGDLGRYYRDYVELMAHFDSVLPGRVHRVFYENMVRDPEGEIRRLLAYCGMPFEDSCLRFYETDRGVLTASSEQVRRPIFDHGVEQWRHYEAWLGPLKTALGPVLDRYPAVPGF